MCRVQEQRKPQGKFYVQSESTWGEMDINHQTHDTLFLPGLQ